MKRSILVVGTIALFMTGMVMGAVNKGDVEMDGLAGGTSISGETGTPDTDVLFIAARAGYFVTENIQVGGVGTWMSIDNSVDTDIYGLGVFGKFHFMPDKQWVPYAGAQFMWGSADMGDTSTDGYIYGPLVGVRYELTPTTDLFIEGQYNLFGGDFDDAFKDMWMVMVGLVHQLR